MAWTFREHMRILRAVRCRDRKMTMRWLGEHIRGGKRKALAWYDWHQQQPDRPAEASMLQASFVSPAALRNRMSVYGLSTRQRAGETTGIARRVPGAGLRLGPEQATRQNG